MRYPVERVFNSFVSNVIWVFDDVSCGSKCKPRFSFQFRPRVSEFQSVLTETVHGLRFGNHRERKLGSTNAGLSFWWVQTEWSGKRSLTQSKLFIWMNSQPGAVDGPNLSGTIDDPSPPETMPLCPRLN